MSDAEHAIVTLHDPAGCQIGTAQIVPLRLPPLWRRAVNTILRKPDALTAPDPIEWDWSKGEIPAGVTVATIRVTTPDWVQEYAATGPPR